MSNFSLFKIQTDSIENNMLLPASPDEGARTIFSGMIRNYNKEKTGVLKVEYHCYREMAEQEGQKILVKAMEKFEINRVACVHRIGILSVEETAIRLEIGSGHRLPGIKACEYIMDEIKLHVPIWKKEFCQDGESWV